jgi:hypothetical protein
MKKRFLAVPLVACAAIGVGYAADLHGPHIGASCPTGFVGNYHFVNNQIPEGAYTGTLEAYWDSGNSCTVTSYKVLNRVQHFRCTGMAGALTAAFTNLPGKLVLSDYSCRRVKTCDPKTEKCE